MYNDKKQVNTLISFLITLIIILAVFSFSSPKNTSSFELTNKQMEELEMSIEKRIIESEKRTDGKISQLEQRMDDNIEAKIIDAGSYMSNKTMEAGEAIKEGFKAAKEKYNENK